MRRARWKRKNVRAQILPCGQVWAKRGSGESVPSKLASLLPGASGSLGTEKCFPAAGGVGAAFGVVVGFGTLLAPCVPLRYALPGWKIEKGRFKVGRAAAAGKRRSNRSCTLRRTMAVRRGRRAESFSKTEPAPSADADSTSQGLLLGPPHHKQIRHNVPFCAKRLFLPPGAAHSFSARRKRMGGASLRYDNLR